MPASTSPEKIAQIEFQGGRCHLVDDPAERGGRGPLARRGLRRALHGPVHLRRAGHRLAGQQQHRRVDLRADGAGAAPDPRPGSWWAPAPAAPARPSAGTSGTGGSPPSSAWSTRRTRRSTRPGWPPTGRYATGQGSRIEGIGRPTRRGVVPALGGGPDGPGAGRGVAGRHARRHRRCSAAGWAAPPAPTCGARSA